MIKAIFFDIDGTFLSQKDGSLPESTRYALYKLKRQGIKIFIASGRHLCEIKHQPINDISFDGYVCLNGQLGFDKDKNIVYAFPIDQDDTNKIIDLFNDNTVPIALVEEKRLYLNFSNPMVEKAQQAISSPVPKNDVYNQAPIYQATAFVDEQKAKQIMKKLKNCKMTRWNHYGIDIISNIGGKAFGIEQMLRLHKLHKSEIMAFGDSENDIGMLRYAHIGIAMDNAIDEVKEAADYITASVDEDGILKALQDFHIITD